MPAEGLTSAQAASILQRDGPNTLPEPERRGPFRVVIEVLKEPMLVLLIVSGLIYLALGELSDALILAVPSKGRLMEQTMELFERAGLPLRKVGSERGYRGRVDGIEGVDVVFVSASEIAEQLKTGRAHLGVTGEDLVRERVSVRRGHYAGVALVESQLATLERPRNAIRLNAAKTPEILVAEIRAALRL